MKVKINRDLCIGCGVCESVCPKVFEMDENNIAVVKINPVPEELESCVENAAESCAVDAIETDK